MYSDLLMQNEPSSRSSRTGHRRAGHASSWHADKLSLPGIGWPRRSKIGRADLDIVQNEPEFRLQLDSLQGLTSDGFVSPPAIEPNHDMGRTDESVELVSSPIENETALVDAPLGGVVGCTFSIANTRETRGAEEELSGCPDRSFLEVSGYSVWLHRPPPDAIAACRLCGSRPPPTCNASCLD